MLRAIEDNGADVIVPGSTTMHQSHAYLAGRLPVLGGSTRTRSLQAVLCEAFRPSPASPQQEGLSQQPRRPTTLSPRLRALRPKEFPHVQAHPPAADRPRLREVLGNVDRKNMDDARLRRDDCVVTIQTDHLLAHGHRRHPPHVREPVRRLRGSGTRLRGHRGRRNQTVSIKPNVRLVDAKARKRGSATATSSTSRAAGSAATTPS